MPTYRDLARSLARDVAACAPLLHFDLFRSLKIAATASETFKKRVMTLLPRNKFPTYYVVYCAAAAQRLPGSRKKGLQVLYSSPTCTVAA